MVDFSKPRLSLARALKLSNNDQGNVMVTQRKIKVIKRTQHNLETSSPHEHQKPESDSRDSVRAITNWVRAFRERQRQNNAKGFKALFG